MASGARGQDGMVLVVVLCIVLGLVTLLLLFAEGMRMGYRASTNGVAALEAGQALDGAKRYLLYTLGNLATPGEMPTADTFENEDVPVGDAAFWIIGREDDELKEADTPTFGLIDEASKLNLNTATREMIEGLPNMTPDIAAAIMDWRNSPKDAQPDGAQSPAYLAGNPAYQCKNAPFESVEELRLVRGVTEDLLYGQDRNRNGILDPNEVAEGGQGAVLRGIADLVTVYTREPNTRPNGEKRIDVRPARNPELATYLQERLGTDRATAIMEATRTGSTKLKSLLEFYVLGHVTAEEALQIDEALTANDGDYIEGRVNVNTAPREVLFCLPGVGEKYADALIALRRTKSPEQLASTAWILEAMAPADAVRASEHITTRSYQYGADIVAVGKSGRAMRRSWMVFDTSHKTPFVAYRYDEAHLGWPLGTAIRETLDAQKVSDKEAK